MVTRQLSAVSHQLSAVLSAISCRLSALGYQLSAASHQLSPFSRIPRDGARKKEPTQQEGVRCADVRKGGGSRAGGDRLQPESIAVHFEDEEVMRIVGDVGPGAARCSMCTRSGAASAT